MKEEIIVHVKPLVFSIEIDLDRMNVVRIIVGVIPNVCCKGHSYSWEELAALITEKKVQ